MRPLLQPLPLTIPVPDVLREQGLTDELIIAAQQPVLRVIRAYGWEVEEVPVKDEFTWYEEPILTRDYLVPVTYKSARELGAIAFAFESEAIDDAASNGEEYPICPSCFMVWFKEQEKDPPPPPPTMPEILEGIRGQMKSVRETMDHIEARLSSIEALAETPS
ncbi:hypothetical protein BN873_890019 [Candidatus Competibacter denitrificans Run_A_D11]|uniref:Uncharacterized protein n=1 Tax=Candidatus Competibacter denitrificans Run_A_D11 TaxID=1400863 RepID=W6ME73_9GAMM|nr:hypothetical protein [Candidatus Competibacter denitrificans]CDI04113.1 hypothetical protein BN873_890019 [Candidatus Competibacter denitrificans Run_A_D11]HAS87213.1 hypothetical protein [Candidatus Competibacteraceae bacterium]HRC69967.1 hypothetical protein [Candidatus Competibacter denitrificans]